MITFHFQSDLNNSKSFLFKAEFLDKTVEVWWLKPFFFFLPQSFSYQIEDYYFRFFHAVRLIGTLFFLGSLDRIIQELRQMQLDASRVKSRIDLSFGLRNIASDRGFRISDNQGLGNCMFYALSEQLEIVKGIKIPHGELRQNLVQYLRSNPKLVC